MAPKRLAAIACYGTALAAMGVFFVLGLSRAFALEREIFWLQASGWGALIALIGALSTSPIARVVALARKRSVEAGASAFRRALGITAAALATGHAALAISTYLADAWLRTLAVPWMRGGALAWAILAALWLTSYPALVRALRVKLWKPLHRLAYAAALFAFQHAILSPLAPRTWVLIALAGLVLLWPLRLLPRPKARRSDP
jgi:sulfoxide reductase heme-binding subunit YedZ